MLLSQEPTGIYHRYPYLRIYRLACITRRPLEEAKAFSEQNVIELIEVEGADHRFQNPACMDRAIASILAFFGLR